MWGKMRKVELLPTRDCETGYAPEYQEKVGVTILHSKEWISRHSGHIISAVSQTWGRDKILRSFDSFPSNNVYVGNVKSAEHQENSYGPSTTVWVSAVESVLS